MKPKSSPLAFLALSGSALLFATQAHANYYWDSNSTAAGLGDAAGTWGSSTFWGSAAGASHRIIINGTLTTANTTIAAGNPVYFGKVNLGPGSTTLIPTVFTCLERCRRPS